MNSPEEQWQDVDETVILVQILMELKRLNATLQPATDSAEQRWACRHCSWEGTDRQDHLGTHGATKGMLDEVFEPT